MIFFRLLVSRWREVYSFWGIGGPKFKISKGYKRANWAETGKLQFCLRPSEILNLRSSNTPETVDFTPP